MSNNDTTELTRTEAYDLLTRALPYTPIDEIAQALQLVVERVTFSDIAMRANTQGVDKTKEQLDAILGQDVPKPLAQYCQHIVERQGLAMLHGDTGILFLQEYLQSLRQVHEVEFTTAVKLREHTKQEFAAMIQQRYAEPIRVVYTTSPGVVAGFVLRDGDTSINLSLGMLGPMLLKRKLGLTEVA